MSNIIKGIIQEAKAKEKEADYGPEYQAMAQRAAQRAKELAGGSKTVWDEKTRRYKVVPANQVKENDIEEGKVKDALLKGTYHSKPEGETRSSGMFSGMMKAKDAIEKSKQSQKPNYNKTCDMCNRAGDTCTCEGVAEGLSGPLSSSDYMKGATRHDLGNASEIEADKLKRKEYEKKHVKTFTGNKEKEAHEYANQHGHKVVKHSYPAGHTNMYNHEYHIVRNGKPGVTEGEELINLEPHLKGLEDEFNKFTKQHDEELLVGKQVELTTVKGRVVQGILDRVNPDSYVLKVAGTTGGQHGLGDKPSGNILAIKKDRVKSMTPVLDEDLPPPENARKTQIAGTLPTYKKAADLLNKTGVQGKALDFGAGLGMGTGELGPDAHSYEPFPGDKFKPHFVDVTKIPDNSYHKIVNLNVLNVVPNVGDHKIRDSIVKNIGRVLAPGGVALITTRGKDVLTIKGTPGEEPMSMISKIGTYQKGFSQTELKQYVQSVLGDGFEVSSIKLGPAGVMIKKLDKEDSKLNEAVDESWIQAYKALEANGGEPDVTKPTLFIKQLAMLAKDAGIQPYYLNDFVSNYISDSLKSFKTAGLVKQALPQAPSITDIKQYEKQSQAADTSFAQQQDIGRLQHELSAQQLVNQNKLETADAEQLVQMDAEARFAIQAKRQELALDAKERLHKLQMEIDATAERKEVRDHELRMAQAGYTHEINVINASAEGEYKKAKLEADYQIQIKQLQNIDNAGERQNKLDQINADKAKQIEIIDAETRAKINTMQKEVDVERQQQDMQIEKAFMMTFNPIWGAALTAAHAAGATWDAGISNLKKALKMLGSPIMPKPQKVKEDDSMEPMPEFYAGQEITWRPKFSKMIMVPATVVAVAPGKLKIKLQSPRMISNYGKDTIVVSLDKIDVMPKQGVAEAGYGRNRGYAHGFASPTAPQLGRRSREDDEGNSEFDDKMRAITGMIFYNNVDNPEEAIALGLKQTRTGKWFLRTGNRFAQQIADKRFGPGKVWYPKNESIAEEGEAKQVDMKRWMRDFDRREDKNFHTENMIAIAKLVGTPEEIKMANDIKKEHMKQGHLSHELYTFRQVLFKKLWPLVVEKLKAQGLAEDWQKANKSDKTDGMSPKAVKAYRRENPGSKLKTAVTTKPSKLKAGSKDAKRRKSFCARMSGNPGPMKDEKGRPTPKAKALNRWNCNESRDMCKVCGQTPCNCTSISSIMKGIRNG